MSGLEPYARRRPPRRRVWPRALALVVAGLLIFWIGISLGKALSDRPQAGGTQTLVRTLEPLPQKAP